MSLLRSLFLLAMLACSTVVLLAQQVTGTLTAQGEGTPRLYMTNGSVQISGNGTLMVSHNAKLTFAGAAPTAKPGKLAGQEMDAYNDFNGSATITGSNYSVGMYGTGIALTATGNGFAILFGTGAYALTGANQQTAKGNWTLAPWMKGGKNVDPKTIAVNIGQLNEVQASGSLSAQGDGSPRLYMTSGTVQIAGNGTLMVSHNAKVTFAGAAPTAKPGKLAGQEMDAYNDFTGSATITGDHYAVGMYAKGITLSASGAGYAMLFGTGSYTDTAADKKAVNGNWTAMPTGSTHVDMNAIKILIGQIADVYNIGNYK